MKLLYSGNYKITNKINGKIYIGSTRNFTSRWWSHRSKNNKGCIKLFNAMKKYGKNNFILEPIEYINIRRKNKREAQKILWNREQFYLDLLKPFGKNGYNINKTSSNNHQQVGSHSFTHKKPVSQFSLNGKWIANFPSMKKASNLLNICATAITECCKGNKKSAGGFMWALKTKKRKIKSYKNNLTRSIRQYSQSGKLIKTWKSQSEAAHALNFRPSGIWLTCQNRQKTSCGFIWKYHEN